jgi:hypothetical protein
MKKVTVDVGTFTYIRYHIQFIIRTILNLRQRFNLKIFVCLFDKGHKIYIKFNITSIVVVFKSVKHSKEV